MAADYAFLGTDLHSHLLPGIDDGAPDPDASLLLIRELMALGFNKLITTPHVIHDLHPNTRETIAAAMERLQAVLEREDIRIPFRAAAEYMADEYFEKLLGQKALLTLDDEQKVLIEFSTIAPPLDAPRLLFDIQMKGYLPVLAHPERYRYWHKHPSELERIKNAGAFLQVNLTSLAGFHGKSVEKTAWWLVRQGWVDFLATDLHHERHLQALRAFRKDGGWRELQQHGFLNKML
ncbi:capsular polysaccharide biosynthesis protein [Compostibacter hankyongensis]|uniref:protein-tyrosine-phosphatase n=1 Tax=Compostibacter hankyongensis TaxID=1007089 RepID=A0ABP8FUQ8_9BACT